MALPRRLYKKIRTSIRQHEATTGRRVSPSILRALMESELTVESGRASERVRFEEAQRATGVLESQREREITSAERAARTAGTAGLIEAGAMTALVGKRIGVGKRLAPTTGRIGRGAQALAVKEATVTTPIITGAPSVGTLYSTGAEISAPTLTGTTPATATAAAPTAIGTAAKVAAPAAIGYTAGRLGAKIPIGKGETAAKVKGGIAGGVATALLLGTNPVGLIIGVATGIIGGGKVICTELHRQGFISTRILGLDAAYAHQTIDRNTFRGYWLWSEPYVRLMQNEVYGNIFTWLIKPFGIAWAYHLAHQLDEEIPDSKLGWFLQSLGVPICRQLGKWFGGGQ